VINICLNEKGCCQTQVNDKCILPGWIRGQGEVVNPNFPAALKVTFPEEPQLSPNLPNYLVHKTDYKSYALVGDPSRKFLFFLSRERVMKKKKFIKLLDLAKSLGYKTEDIIINSYMGQPTIQ
jgi:lipocalin